MNRTGDGPLEFGIEPPWPTETAPLRPIEVLRPRLFDPLGIENPVWETDPRGRNIGGSGLHLPTEAIARFGQMYLQNGVWRGKRILPEAWIAEATAALKVAVEHLSDTIATARRPGMPLATISAITREAPLASLFIAFLFGVAVARRR